MPLPALPPIALCRRVCAVRGGGGGVQAARGTHQLRLLAERREKGRQGGPKVSACTTGENGTRARKAKGHQASAPAVVPQVLEIQNRIHRLVGIPEAFGESIYVLQYSDGAAAQRRLPPGSLRGWPHAARMSEAGACT